jgi:HD-GYP domain-containing protein (c-di-GMP phosphodiesterase class II)
MSENRRAVVHYLVIALVMGIYGGQVCPFLDSISIPAWLTLLLLVLAVQFFLRDKLLRLPAVGLEAGQDSRVFLVESSLFILSSVVIAFYNWVVYGAPVESGIKVVVGLGGLGFFAAVDLALEAELRLARRLKEQGRNLVLNRPLFPLSRKLGLFASVSTALAVTIYFMLAYKDLDWLVLVGSEIPVQNAALTILAEFAFVGIVLLGYIFAVIHSYTRNIRYFFDNQASVMADTTKGQLDGWVPVTTNDEFGEIALYTNDMVKDLRERTEELQRTQDVTIISLASLAETRDNETGAHLLRTQRYVKVLADRLRDHPRFSADLADDETIELLFKSAPLHDIGKVGIPDAILLKPGRLDDEEFRIMKTHADLGADALRDAEKCLGSSSFLRFAREIARGHHEKWDGSGYPSGLKGEEIPVSARLMAVADVYDALISKRVYKPAFSHDKAKAIITEGRGAHFDPDVVDAFLAIEDRVQAIAHEFSDEQYAEQLAAS